MTPEPTDVNAELERRMAGPQRHRLLHGYPMVPLMRSDGLDEACHREADGSLWALADGQQLQASQLELDASRPLIVGILPHSMCTPKVQGCGFCTFPHSAEFDRTTQRSQQASVVADIQTTFKRVPQLASRKVDALYFGGATANLMQSQAMNAIVGALAEHVDLSTAEVSLEGVPRAFLTLLGDRLGELAELDVASRRISMGIQTFSDEWLRKMGRSHFGDAKTFARVVRRAQNRDISTSGDFLSNLPGQSRSAMLEDIARADDLGLDQICIYHLVLYEGLGTPWSEDPKLLAALPSNAEACENWLALRESLQSRGFEQRTLTNFERRDRPSKRPSFRYENCSYRPERYDALGFGPHSISTLTDKGRRRALKVARGQGLQGDFNHADLYFEYEHQDLELLMLTRWLAGMSIDWNEFEALFGPVSQYYRSVIQSCEQHGLVTRDASSTRLTAKGMFYADSVSGSLAHQRVSEMRAHAAGIHTMQRLDEPYYETMG